MTNTLPAHMQAFPRRPACKLPCPHEAYVKAAQGLIKKGRYAEAARIVNVNSVEAHPTPHDWTADLSLADAMKLRHAAQEELL